MKVKHGLQAEQRFLRKTVQLPARLTYLERCAVHEAGHAVAMHLIRQPILEATIVRSRDADGHVAPAFLPWYSLIRPRHYFIDYALVYASGSFAETLFSGEYTFDDDDYAELRHEVQRYAFLHRQHVTEYTRRLWHRAKPMAEAHQTAIRYIAGELICHQTLTGYKLRQLFRGGSDA